MLVNGKMITIKDVHINWHADSLKNLKRDIGKTNLIAIGEVHGVKENVNFYYTIAKKFKFNAIALEYPTDLKLPLEKYIEGGEFPKHHALKELDDGRVSYEMLACLKTLYKEGIIKSIICFDGQIDINHWNERDTDYAKQFLNNYNPDLKTLIIAGRYHVRTEPFYVDFEEGKLYGMCYHLKQKLGIFPVCTINYDCGKFYNFGVKEFGKAELNKSLINFSFSKQKEMKYHFLIKEAMPVEMF